VIFSVIFGTARQLLGITITNDLVLFDLYQDLQLVAYPSEFSSKDEEGLYDNGARSKEFEGHPSSVMTIAWPVVTLCWDWL